MKIGELAKETRTPVETVRFYERIGLLPAPRRTASNYRMYDDNHAERLRFIRNCRTLDMTLDEVRALLVTRDDPERCCKDANDLLDEHIEHVVGRIAELKGLEDALRELRRQCEEPRSDSACGVMTGLSTNTTSFGVTSTPSTRPRVRKVMPVG